MTLTNVSSSTITVLWGSIPRIHQNGDITGYSVQYGVMGTGNVNTQTKAVSGGSTTNTHLSSLTILTNYSIQVAAVNSAGTGAFSNPVVGFTDLS